MFRSVDSKHLDPEIRKGLVQMKLETSRKAGTLANQRSAAATAWVSAHGGGGAQQLASVQVAWTGDVAAAVWQG